MYVQFSEGFPGIVIQGVDNESRSGERIFVDRTRDLTRDLQQLYSAYLEGKHEEYCISEAHAAGLYSFLSHAPVSSLAVKGHVTGPISWGLTITDQDRKSIIYDDTLSDAVARLLRMKATWQEHELKKLNKNTIIFIDEPYMSSYGSAFFSVSRDKVVTLIREVMGGISGLKGIHCCGNTDWALLLGIGLDIVNFDAYNYAGSLAIYPEHVKRFIDGSGTIAWGIVPTFQETLSKETVSSLKDRLEEAMAPFTRQGIRFRDLVAQGLLTPSCGLGTLPTPDAAQMALELLTGLSDLMRRRYL